MEPWQFKTAKDLELPPTERYRSIKRENGLFETSLQVSWLMFIRTWMRVWHRLEFRGRELLPNAPPFVIVANHASHLDAPALACLVPKRLMTRVVPIAAGDVFFENRALAAFAALCANAFPIWRRRRMMGAHGLEELRARLLQDGLIYILFPEGTRTRSGELQPVKPGLGLLVAGTGVPVVPCRLSGTFEAGPPGAKFPRPKKIIVRLGPPLCFESIPNDHGGWQHVGASVGEALHKLG